jgi:uncharacterized protein (TIGR02246 family)
MHTRAAVQALVERQARAWEQADLDAITADFAPEGWFISPGGRWQGPAAVRAAAEAFYAMSGAVRIDIVRVIYDGERQGAVEWLWQETRKSDGQTMRAEDGIIFELNAAGQIVYWREYFDPAQMA